jgi:hypothetical protein
MKNRTYLESSSFFLRALIALSCVYYFTGCTNNSGAGSADVASQTFGLKLNIIEGDQQTAAPGRLFSKPLTVQVTNVLGEPVAGVNVLFALESGTGFYITPSTVKTSMSGFASIEVKGPDVYDQPAKISAKIENTSIVGEFNVGTNANNPSLHFEIETTYGNEVTAGKPFGYIIRVINANGKIEDVNDTITTQWTVNTDSSWGGQAPTNVFTSYTCVFKQGECRTEENIVLTNSRKPTVIFMGDGNNTGFDDVFSYELKVKPDVLSKMIITVGTGGPDAGAIALNDKLVTTDDAPMILAAAMVDKVGNYISDGGEVTWNGKNEDNTANTIIADSLSPKSGATTSFTPTKTVPHPDYAFITADSARYPQAKSGKITIDPGAPFRLRILTSNASTIQTAGVPFGLTVEALDKKNNLIGNNFSGAGFDGQKYLRFTTSNYSNGNIPTAGEIPWFGLNNTLDVELTSGVNCAIPPCYYPDGTSGKQFYDFLQSFHFSKGRTSSLSSFYSVFFFEANTDPIINVTNIATGDFPAITGSLQLHINSGAPHHIMVRNADGPNSMSLCQGGFSSAPNGSLRYSNVLSFIRDRGQSSPLDSHCDGLHFIVGGPTEKIYYALEDIAGNFIENINPKIDPDSSSDFIESKFLPTTATLHFMSESSTVAGDGVLAVTAATGFAYKSFLIVNISAGSFDHYNFAAKAEGSKYMPTGQLLAGLNFRLFLVPVDEYGNMLSGGAESVPFTDSFSISTTTTGPLIAGGTINPIIPSSVLANHVFTWNPSGRGGYEYGTEALNIPNVATGTVTFSVINAGAASSPKTADLVLKMVPGSIDELQLRTDPLDANSDKVGQAMNFSIDSTPSLYLVGFDNFGNQGVDVLGKWKAINPVPSDCINYSTDPASSIFFVPNKPCSIEKIELTYVSSTGTLTVSTGSVTITAGDLDHFDFEYPPGPKVAGTTFNAKIIAHDKKHNKLSTSGYQPLSIDIRNSEHTVAFSGSYFASYPTAGSFLFTNGETDNLPFTLYNSAFSPLIHVEGNLNGSTLRSGLTTAGSIVITSDTLESLTLSLGNNQISRQIVAGGTATFSVSATDHWGNVITSGSAANLNIKFNLTNGSLNPVQDIVATNLASASSVSGTNNTEVTGRLVNGNAQILVTSTKAGVMTASADSDNDLPINASQNLVESLTILPDSTIMGLRWRTPPTNSYTVNLLSSFNTFSAEVFDKFSNTITTAKFSDNYQVEVALTQGSSPLFLGTKTKTIDNGFVVFDDLKYYKTESISFNTRLVTTPSLSGINSLDTTMTVFPGNQRSTIVVMPNQALNQGVTSATAAITGSPFIDGTSIRPSNGSFPIQVYIVDEAFNVVPGYTNLVTITTSGTTDPHLAVSGPSNLNSGAATDFTITARRQGDHRLVANAGMAAQLSSQFTVTPTAETKLIALLPGQSLSEGAPDFATAASGTISTINAGTAFPVTLYSVDDQFNKITSNNTTVGSLSAVNDAFAINPAAGTLVSGTKTLSMTNKTSGTNKSINLTSTTPALANVSSSTYTVSGGSATKCLVLLPEQTPVPGNATITGTPTSKLACGSISLKAYAVDDYYNTDTNNNNSFILTTTDQGDTDPGTLSFSAGTLNMSYKPVTATNNSFSLSCTGLTTATAPTLTVTLGTGKILTPYFSSLQTFDYSHGHLTQGTALTALSSNQLNAGTAYPVTVVATDQCYNKITDGSTTVTLTTTGSNYLITSAASHVLSAGTTTFNITHYKAFTNRQITTTDTSTYVNNPSDSFDIIAGPAARLVTVMPGEIFVAGQADQNAAASGTPLTQTAGSSGNNYPYKVKVYSTDDYFNLLTTDNSQITLNPSSGISYVSSGTVSLSSGSAEFTIYNTVNSGSFTLKPITVSGTTYGSTEDSEAFEVFAELNAPTGFTLQDPTTSSSTHIKTTSVKANFGGAANATSWCISSGTQATTPSAGTNGKTSCANNILTSGGTSWYTTSNPSGGTFTVTGGTGLKTLYLWVADAANNVYAGTISSNIIYDNVAPNAPAFTISSGSFTNDGLLTVNISSGTVDTEAWCFLEVAGGGAAPSTPTFNTCSGSDGWRGPSAPTTVTASGSLGARKIYLYAKDAAGNISNASTPASFTYDNTAPSGFNITGVKGGTDIVADGWLGTTTTPTVVWQSSVEPTTDITYTIDITGSTCSTGTFVETQITSPKASDTSHELVKQLTGCNLTAGSTYNINITAKDQANNSVNASNNSFQFKVDNSYSSGSFSVAGALSSDGGDVQLDNYLKSGNQVKAAWTQSTISDSLSPFKHYAVSILNNSNSVVCAEQNITDISVVQYDFADCALNNGQTYKIKVDAYDTAGNTQAATGSPFPFTVSTSASYLTLSLITTGTLQAGTLFQVQVVAFKPDGSVDANFAGGNVNYSSNASNGASTCSQSGAALLPEFDPLANNNLNFTSGTAILGVTLKKSEGPVTLTANVNVGSGSISGTIGSLNIFANTAACNKITNANSSPALLSGTTGTLNFNGGNSYTLGLGAFDSWGNYIGLTSGTWTGTSQLVEAPTPSVGSITVITASDAGSGAISVSGSSDTVNFNISVGSLFYGTTTTDYDGNHLLSNSTYKRIFYYDTTLDTSNSWRGSSSKTWYSGGLSSTRGSRPDFPLKVILVATDNSLDLIDDTNQRLFMRFEVNTNYALNLDLGVIQDLAAREGKIFVAMQDSTNHRGGVVILDFKNDKIYQITDTVKIATPVNGFRDRNGNQNWTISTDYPTFDFNEEVWTIHANHIGSEDYLAIGTQTQAYVLKTSNTSALDKFNGSLTAVKNIKLAGNSLLYYSTNNVGLHRTNLSSIINNSSNETFSSDYSYTTTTGTSGLAELPTANLNSLSIAENAYATGPNHILLLGSARGLTSIKENTSNDSLASSVHFSYDGTSRPNYSGANNGVVFDSTNSYLTAAGTGSITNALTVEFWFKPDSASTTGTSTLLLKGTSGADGSFGIDMNRAADGKLAFWIKHNTDHSTYQVKTNSTLAAGVWHHVAGVVDSGVMKLYLDGLVQTTTATLPDNNFDADDGTLYVGSNGTDEGYKGAIDELRISNAAVRSGASFAVPTSELNSTGNTVYLFHFNETVGKTATATPGSNATLNNGAWFAKFLLAGSDNNVLKVAADNNSTTLTVAEVLTSTAWNEIRDLQSTNASKITFQPMVNFIDMLFYHRTSVTTKDLIFIDPGQNKLLLQIK